LAAPSSYANSFVGSPETQPSWQTIGSIVSGLTEGLSHYLFSSNVGSLSIDDADVVKVQKLKLVINSCGAHAEWERNNRKFAKYGHWFVQGIAGRRVALSRSDQDLCVDEIDDHAVATYYQYGYKEASTMSTMYSVTFHSRLQWDYQFVFKAKVTATATKPDDVFGVFCIKWPHLILCH
jgi:hypothetical protein